MPRGSKDKYTDKQKRKSTRSGRGRVRRSASRKH